MGRGAGGPPPVGPIWSLLFPNARSARSLMPPPIRPFPTRPATFAAGRFGRSRSYDIDAGNSNVTTAAHALRACFLSARGLVRVWTSREPETGLIATGQRTVLGFEGALGLGKNLECLVERVALVGGHHAAAQQRAGRRHGGVQRD